MEKHRINYRTLSFVALTAFVILFVLFTSETINNWIFRLVGVQANSLYSHLNENNHLNILLFISVGILMIVYSIKSATDYYRKWKSLCAVIIIDFLLAASMNHWTWSTSVLGINWGWVLILVFTIPNLLSTLLPNKIKDQVVKCMEGFEELIENIYDKCYRINKKGKPDQPDISKESVGFCIDDIDKQTNDEHIRQPYADLLIKKALSTKQEEAIAIGISGSWGSGKTLFLNRIKKSITRVQKDDRNILLYEFYPWESTDSKQIITDFFIGLSNTLKPRYSALKKPILKYSELLTAVDGPKWIVYLAKLFDKNKELTINKRKEIISRFLKKLGEKIFVLIDDIDRLNSDEIHEVLKLIRNTANFPHIIYIVTYDKQYIAEQLQHNHIGQESALLYLEKIFSLEIKLQKPEPHFQVRCLYEMICQMCNKGYLTDNISYICSVNEDIVSRVLKTYRQVKRFARQLAINYETIIKNQLEKDINVEDLFILELIYYYNFELYNILKDEPSILLATTNDKNTKVAIYILRPGVIEQPTTGNTITPYTGTPFDDISEALLGRLFNIPSGFRSTPRLFFIESYGKYFSLGIGPEQVSLYEVHKMFVGNDDIDKQIEKWCEERKHRSLYYLLMTEIPHMDLQECKRYITSVLSLMVHFPAFDRVDVPKLFARAFLASNYKENLRKNLHMHTFSEMERYIRCASKITDYINIAEGLSQLWQKEHEEFEHYGNNGFTFIDSAENAASLLNENISTYLSKHPTDADELFRQRSGLQSLVIASSICVNTGFSNYYMSLIFETLVHYFSVHKGHNKHTAAHYFEIDSSDNMHPNEIKDKRRVKAEMKSQMFSNEDKFQLFIKECFEEE